MTPIVLFPRIVALLGGLSGLVCGAAEPSSWDGVRAAMQHEVDISDVAGAVTLVANKDTVLDVTAVGFADLAENKPMTRDALFWIASMTKPITGVAVLLLRDEGKLQLEDPVATYLPEFAALKTPTGRPANITIAQLLSHTSGLADPKAQLTESAKTLRELVAIYLAQPMQFEPGTNWRYTSSGFNVAGLIVEVISGQPYETFLQRRLFDPLGMADTTFYPSEAQRPRLVRAYRANAAAKSLTPLAGSGRDIILPIKGVVPPLGGGGLYSTAQDYARFCQMLLNRGELAGRHYLSAEGMQALRTVITGDLPTGYTKTKLNHVLGWGLGVAVVQQSEGGVSAELAAGSFGHPGAWGTAAWIDPARNAIYIMMVQRPNMPDNFENPPALAFVHAAATAIRVIGKTSS